MNPTLLPPRFPEPWASEWGEDRAYGLFLILEVNGVRQWFRWLPPGTFMMGSPETEVGRYDDETQHQVTLTKGFWLADTACTQALWQAVMGNNPSRFQDNPDNPVETVSWDDVQLFLERLNAMFPSLNARLPSEAEWEYACRAGENSPFSFGDNITPEQVNYNGDHPYAGDKKGLYREKTVPVKTLPSNHWGLYEMHGNDYEWCADWFEDYPVESVTDPIGPKQGVLRVLRGGSWDDFAMNTRSAYRFRYEPDFRFNLIGFRLALG